uniref:preprotein translocase subunit SecG n=1 Tax=Arenimonas sp. TaxID=1872635 RepID=UPI0025F7EF23|nr:preprotein translocase subunit SecG [Arenimonas sp.]
MLLTIVSVIYVLVAIAMIVLILMQRGTGAAAGSGFGAGASATVFGARGSANFLSSSTKWLAVVFMGMSLGMAWYATHGGREAAQASLEDIGAMSEVPAVSAPAGEVPASDIPAPATDVPATGTDVPAAEGEVPATPAEAVENGAENDAENTRGG